MAETGRHKIFIAGRWEIRDLYEFPHRYAEIYSFLYALQPFGRDSVVFAEAFQRYPWRGGYSAVNFYDEIYLAIPRIYRPHIARIQYSSPGFLDAIIGNPPWVEYAKVKKDYTVRNYE